MTVPKCQELCPFFNECVEENVGYGSKTCTQNVQHLNPLYIHLHCDAKTAIVGTSDPKFVSSQKRRRAMEKLRKHRDTLIRIGLWAYRKEVKALEGGINKDTYYNWLDSVRDKIEKEKAE